MVATAEGVFANGHVSDDRDVAAAYESLDYLPSDSKVRRRKRQQPQQPIQAVFQRRL
jgi:hypothetical protein